MRFESFEKATEGDVLIDRLIRPASDKKDLRVSESATHSRTALPYNAKLALPRCVIVGTAVRVEAQLPFCL
jgi:hypothetical protein